jgi:hypothetical protein
LGDQIEEDEMGETCMVTRRGGGGIGNAYKVLLGKPEDKIPFGRPRI